ARSGLGSPDGVVTQQGAAQYLRLDRRAVTEAGVLNTAHQTVRQREVVEPGLALGGLDDEIVNAPGLGRRLGRAGFALASWAGFLAVLRAVRGLLFTELTGRLGGRRSGDGSGGNRGGCRLDMGLVMRSRRLARFEQFFQCLEHNSLSM